MAMPDRAVSTLKRAVGAVAGLLPDAPSSDSGPPDVDGKRRADLDPEAVRRVNRAAKEGKGGLR